MRERRFTQSDKAASSLMLYPEQMFESMLERPHARTVSIPIYVHRHLQQLSQTPNTTTPDKVNTNRINELHVST